MRDWLIWVVLVVVAVAAGWAWQTLRRNARPRTRPTRPGSRPSGRQTGTRPRPTAPPKPRKGTPAPPAPAGAPQPGEIWWADVPYEDGTGSKVRPCLVLRSDGQGSDVLKITSQDKSHRDDHVRIPTRTWDANADHDSFLDLTDPIRVAAASFEDRAGECDPKLWQQVGRLHGVGGPA